MKLERAMLSDDNQSVNSHGGNMGQKVVKVLAGCLLSIGILFIVTDDSRC